MTLKPLILRQLKKNPKTQREDPLRRTTDGMFLLPLGDGSKTQHMVWTHLQRASPSSSVTRGPCRLGPPAGTEVTDQNAHGESHDHVGIVG